MVVDSTGCPFPPTLADFDGDGDVDQDDFAKIQVCYTGADQGPPMSGCEKCDFDCDNDVDDNDMDLFFNCYSGPNIPATTGCGDFNQNNIPARRLRTNRRSVKQKQLSTYLPSIGLPPLHKI